MKVFQSFIYDEEKINELSFLGAFEEDKLIGILAIRERDAHISLFFVRSDHHRMGIGRELFPNIKTQVR